MASGSKMVIIAALIGNMLISVTKFIAATITGSAAMMSECIHSLVDTGNQILLLYGLKRAALPADEDFPFGYGKEIYFWSFIVAIMIFALGGGISIYQGIHHLQNPEPITNAMVNYIVLGLALLFEGAAWYFAFREFSRVKGRWGYLEAIQRAKDPSIFVVLFEDSAAILGLLVAFVGVWLSETTGILIFDGIARAHIDHVNEILTMHMGPDFILANISVDFDNAISAQQVESDIAAITRSIKQAYPQIKRVFIEAESRGNRYSPG